MGKKHILFLVNFFLIAIYFNMGDIADAMTYHDNDVYMNISSQFEKGYYWAIDAKVTNGQDPKEYYSKCNKTASEFSKDNKCITFKVGRKGSKEVANWFNEQTFNGKSTSFGHSAGKLNFAFLGDLQIDFSPKSNYYGKYVEIFNVLIAQGHNGKNNWWIGQKYGASVGNGSEMYMVGEIKYLSNSSPTSEWALIKFIRGGNGVNNIDIELNEVCSSKSKAIQLARTLN